jgi:hypothetical protein
MGGAYPRVAGDWIPIAQCYVEALRHSSAPNFLGWDVFTGGGPEDDPEVEALLGTDTRAVRPQRRRESAACR